MKTAAVLLGSLVVIAAAGMSCESEETAPPTSNAATTGQGGSGGSAGPGGQAGMGGAGSAASPVPIGSGPGGLGGAASADFDSLIDLITSTIATETWAENGGGEAEIRPFPTNLSLVISQTQAVHEEIADLLEQLRRLGPRGLVLVRRPFNDHFGLSRGRRG